MGEMVGTCLFGPRAEAPDPAPLAAVARPARRFPAPARPRLAEMTGTTDVVWLSSQNAVRLAPRGLARVSVGQRRRETGWGFDEVRGADLHPLAGTSCRPGQR